MNDDIQIIYNLLGLIPLENESEKQELLKGFEEFGDNLELTTSLKLFHKP